MSPSHHIHERRLSSYGRLGVLLAVIGGILAVDVLADIRFIYKLWPLLISVMGIGFIGIYRRRARREASYVGIGVYLIGFSALALYCNMTSWAELATLWPVFIALMGLSCVLGYYFGTRRPLLLLAGLLLFSTAAVFFFVFGLSARLWWTVFILAGASFLVFDRVRQSS